MTPLRIGFLVQFLLIVGVGARVRQRAAARRRRAPSRRSACFGGLHLALVAMFAVTEDLVVPRRVLLRDDSRVAVGAGCSRCSGPAAAAAPSTCWCRWRSCSRRRGCCDPTADESALVPGDVRLHLLLHRRAGRRASDRRDRRAPRRCKLRVAVLLLAAGRRWCCPTSLYYVLWQPEVLDLEYSARAI